jgi:tetratricopeptide (TPR) repeat protein
MKKIIVLRAAISILFCGIVSSFGQAVSEEARRYLLRGVAAVEAAKTAGDYDLAVKEFEQAAKIAPDWPDIYYNLGSVQSKAGDFASAIKSFKRYLELAPNASDASQIRDEIYKLEYRAEQARSKEINRDGRYIAYKDGTVLDKQTNLMWAAKDNGEDILWQDSKNYCKNYRGGGYSDWRMPTLDELEGLYDSSKSYRASKTGSDSIDVVHLTSLIQLSYWGVWSSETRVPSGYPEFLEFKKGTRNMTPPGRSGYIRALPVRLVK